MPGDKITWYDFHSNIPYASNNKKGTKIPSYNNVEKGEIIRPPVYVFAKGGTILFEKDRVKKSALLARNDTGFNLTIYLN